MSEDSRKTPTLMGSKSVLERSWMLRACPSGEFPGPVCFADGGKVSTRVLEIAWRRGASDVEAFLNPSLRCCMPDPCTLANMSSAVERFCRAVEIRESIAVLGDYDVDGATSTSLLLRYQRMLGLQQGLFHIPQRLTEGYGPNIPAIQSLYDQGAKLLIIADSGTGAMVQIGHARSIGLDVIVLDHHEPNPDGSIPNAIVVNPKLEPNDGSLSYLCTAGLTFLFLVACNRYLRSTGFFERKGMQEPRLQGLLGLVALGTVADVVPLVGLNRAYVYQGLEHMSSIPGIAALQSVVNEQQRKDCLEAARTHKEVDYTAYSCGFVFGPCINAGGRISDTRQGTWLLSSDDPDQVNEIARNLSILNRERQSMQKTMVEECFERIESRGEMDSVLVIYNEAWHPGVVGLGASKVKDRFDRSAVVIGKGGKGSGRSVEGFNIGQAFLRAAACGLLVKGGGHCAAAGLTIDPARIDEFRVFMNQQSQGTQRPPTMVDLVVEIGALSSDDVPDFELLSPFGMGNSKPKVAFLGGVLEKIRVLKGKHIKAVLTTHRHEIDVILFNGVDTPLGNALLGAEKYHVDLLGEVSINSFRGDQKIQVKPSDACIGTFAG